MFMIKLKMGNIQNNPIRPFPSPYLNLIVQAPSPQPSSHYPSRLRSPRTRSKLPKEQQIQILKMNQGILQSNLSLSYHNIKSPNYLQLLSHLNLQNIQKLDLSRNKLYKLDGLLRANIKNVQQLCLNNNLIESIKPLVECDFKKLKFLKLSRNSIWHINDLNDPVFQHLQSLILENNRIASLAPMAQAVYTKLSRWDISNNPLKSLNGIDKAPLECIQNLYISMVDVSDISPLVLNTKMVSSMDSLNLSNNHNLDISSLQLGNFSNLKTLDLAFCNLSDLSPLIPTNISSVEYLNLGNNQIESIECMMYINCPNLQLLYLQNNSIVDINPMLYFPFRDKLKRLLLMQNRICDMSVFFRWKRESDRELFVLMSSNPLQQSQKKVFKKIKSGIIFEFDNDWIDDQSDQSIIIGCYFKSHIPLMNVLKEQKHQELLEILLSQHRFHTQPFAMDSFSIDLILVVDIPQSPDRVLKKSVSPLSMMRKKISPLVAEAYREALEKIEISTHESSDNLKYVRNIGGLRREEEQIVTANEWRQGEVMKSSYTGTGVKDLFTVNLNIVIYTLQKECGFNVEKYIINDKVFLLLNCQQENLRRAAVLHHIKKEVVYSQVDIYLNQPLDSKNRPISLNKKFKNLQNSFERKEGHTEQRLLFQNNSIDEELLKKYHRKLGDVQNYAHEIIDQVELSSWEIEKFERFMGEYVKLLRTFDQSPVTEEMTGNQREYLRKILNKEGRINEGAMKIFQEIKRKKEYFQNLTELVENSGYKTFSPSTIYTSFFELNKKKKYADRVRSLLMFKPLVSGPEGELQLFLRMERTRLSYLVLLEYFRIENFPQYGIEFYTLHNSFEKYGNTDKEVLEGVDGGLDGYNLEKSWSVFTPWNSNIKVIRDYLGESFAYFTFLKNQLIYALILLSPIALIAFLIIVLVLPLNITHNSHLDTFVFFTVYSFIILIWFSAYTIRQDQSQAFHFGTLRQTSIRKTPNFGYKSPYVRNLISDSVNQYKEVKSIFNKVKELLGLLFVIVLLCIDIGVFYGIRSWSLILQRQIPRSRLFFEWYSFIPLFTFFMGNHIVYMFGLKRLFKYITSLENNPNLQKDESSFEVKCLLFRIGVELIGPIDLMVVEALGNHNCYDSSCWNAYESFINIRYIVVFILLVVRFASLLIVKIINKVKVKEETEKDLKETQIRTEEQSKIKKLFVKIIKEYSKKQHSIDIEEEILILIQLALFSMIQPISALINLFMTLLDFYLQRLQILKIWRRPINTALSTPDYSILIKVPFYIFCSFNSWLLLVNFQDLEYVNPHFYLTFLRTPTKDAITTLKIIFAFFLFCLMLLFQFIFRKIYNSNNEYSQLIARKERKLANYLYKYKKMKGGTWSNAHKPIMHIGRVKF